MTENIDLRNPQKNLKDFMSKIKELKMAMARVVSHLLVPLSIYLTGLSLSNAPLFHIYQQYYQVRVLR